MKAILILLALLTGVPGSNAQTVTARYNWDSIPLPHTLSESEAASQVIGLKDKRILEYAYDDERMTDLVMYYTKHVIVKVNTADGIEQFNRIYLPVGGAMQIIDIKARSVSKSGRVVNLDEDDIKISESDEEQGQYRYFAMEGLEPGSEVEYLFKMKYDAALYGDERLQAGYSKKNVSFDLYVPLNFIFSTQSYNGLPVMKIDSSYQDAVRHYLSVEQIPPLKEEPYSAYEANLQRVEYTVRFNTAISDRRVLDWDAAAAALHALYFEADKSEVKEVQRMMKLWKPAGDAKNRVIQLDNYLKSQIAIQPSDDQALSNLADVLKNKVANTKGITRLYIQCLKAINLAPELAVTTNRYHARFDAAFETWNYLDEILLFVPDVGVYLAPDQFTARGGLPPQDFEDNDGLFISSVSTGNRQVAVSRVGRIEASRWTDNRHDIYATVEVDPVSADVKVRLRQEFTGHAAEFVQSYFQFMNEEDKEKLLGPVVQLIGRDGRITNLSFSNQLESDRQGRPFIIESDIQIASLLERAGSRLLFKIGNIIGQQVEMYSEVERQNDVENEFNRGYYREITFNIPDGYAAKNLEAVKKHVEAGEHGTVPYYFHSDYSKNGNTVKVSIQEVYQQLRYPADKFEEFRKVVNAAADWNKVVLIFEKVN